MILLVLGLLVQVGAGLVLGHYAAQGRGNEMRGPILMLTGFGALLEFAAFVTSVVAVIRRPRHWTTWTVLGVVVLSTAFWFGPWVL
ncbi:MAG TPA: hypothetical protein VF479_01900 [Pseudolysinimonas sp.]